MITVSRRFPHGTNFHDASVRVLAAPPADQSAVLPFAKVMEEETRERSREHPRLRVRRKSRKSESFELDKLNVSMGSSVSASTSSTSTIRTVTICVIVTLLVQMLLPLLLRISSRVCSLQTHFPYLNHVCPVAERDSHKLLVSPSARPLLSSDSLKHVVYFEEPFPVEKWMDSADRAELLPQAYGVDLDEYKTDPVKEAEALAAVNAAKTIRISGNTNKLRQARSLLSHALALAPHHPDVLTECGRVEEMCADGDLLKAEGYYTRALAFDPHHEDALVLRARTQPAVAALDSSMLTRIHKKKDAFRSLHASAELRRTMRDSYFSHIYHTVAIEGNTLSLGQTRSILETGMAVEGKSVREHNEVLGMDAALRFLNASLINQHEITVQDILEMHRRVLGHADPDNAGRFRNTQVYVGRFTPVAAHLVDEQMAELVEWLNHPRTADMPPIERAAIAHYKLVVIHPFADGNGRTARLLLNLILMRSGYPPVILRVEERAEYYACLHTGNLGDLRPFVRLVARNVDTTLQGYINAVSTCDPLTDSTCNSQPELS